MSRSKPKTSKKRRRDRRRGSRKILKQRTREKFPQMKVVDGPASDGVSMSEVLEQFIEPYRYLADTEKAYRKLLTTAITAWNVALFPEKERSSRLDELLAALPRDVREDDRQSIEELMVRKERFFSQYRRMIVDFELADGGDKWHLSVMSVAGKT